MKNINAITGLPYEHVFHWQDFMFVHVIAALNGAKGKAP